MAPVPDQAEQGRRALEGLSRLFERIAPWLVDVGTWVFGGLMALNLVIIAALITVGPVDVALLVAVAAFACALPLEVAGMILLRLSKDVDDIRLEDLTLRSFDEARFPNIQAYFPASRHRASAMKRRTRVTLAYVFGIATFTGALTVTGMVAALWHMARWVAEVSLAAVVVSVVLIVAVAAHAMPRDPQTARRVRNRHVEKASRDPRAAKEREHPQ